jgi:hypothetical protein
MNFAASNILVRFPDAALHVASLAVPATPTPIGLLANSNPANANDLTRAD